MPSSMPVLMPSSFHVHTTINPAAPPLGWCRSWSWRPTGCGAHCPPSGCCRRLSSQSKPSSVGCYHRCPVLGISHRNRCALQHVVCTQLANWGGTCLPASLPAGLRCSTSRTTPLAASYRMHRASCLPEWKPLAPHRQGRCLPAQGSNPQQTQTRFLGKQAQPCLPRICLF